MGQEVHLPGIEIISVPRYASSTFFVPTLQIKPLLCAPETPWLTHSPAQGLRLSKSRQPACGTSAKHKVPLLPAHLNKSRVLAEMPGMNPAVPELGNGLLGDGAVSWSWKRAADSAGERRMPLPVSLLLCQVGKTLLVLGLNFISVTSWRARLAAFLWTSLSVQDAQPSIGSCRLGSLWQPAPLPLLWVCCSPGSCRVL